MLAAIELSALDLALAAALLLVSGAVSLGLRLGLERNLLIAAVRTVCQLLLLGFVLREVFALEEPWALALLAMLMLSVAAHSAVRRPRRIFRGATLLAFLTLICAGLLTSIAVTAGVIGVQPFWKPQYFIPLLGMILGNSLTGISLCLDHLLESLVERRAEIEMELSLGATRWEAARVPLREAVRRGMIPIINAMMVVGLVSLPGMMTGQILAGADPLQAVEYQIVVMFMIAAAVALGCILIALLVYRRFFNARHQVRPEGIVERPGR